MKLSEIQQLIKFVSKSGISEIEIENKDFKINIKTPSCKEESKTTVIQQPQMMPQMMQPQQMQMQQQMPAQPAAVESKKEEVKETNYIEIKSPMIGTFYRKPSPDKPEFVKVGDTVNKGDFVCVIEAMKLFNEIESEVSGKIVKVLVDDNTPVEYDQPLFLVEPIS